MPNIATQLYHKNPGLQVLLDFLARCEPDGQRLTADYQDAQALDAVKAACANSGIHPMEIIPAAGRKEGNAQASLALDLADWLALSITALPLLTQELRLRLPAINAALKFAPLRWHTLALPDSAMSAWGAAAGMVALPRQTVFDYFGSRYPSDAEQRGRYAVLRDVEHAAGYKKDHALGFLINTDDTQNFACNADDWSREVSSARSLLNHHVGLMLKIGLQMLEAGIAGQLKELRSVLLLAGDAPPLVKLQTLLGIYEEHLATYGDDQGRFRSKLLKDCVGHFEQWQTDCKLVMAYRPGTACQLSPTGITRERKWADPGVPSTGTARLPDALPPLPALLPLASRTGAVPAAESSPRRQMGAVSPIGRADRVIADGVTIPQGVTVARGAHVRVCDISVDTRLKPGTVLHGDVSIASHTTFDGPVKIMNDVRIGRGLKLGSGLTLTEGATISTFAVRSALPQGTRIGGNLRIGSGSNVGRNVSFGAENWIGDHVRIGENVQFGSCVLVDSGVSIGANARVEGPARVIGDVPENADIAGHAMESTMPRNEQEGSRCALGIAVFTIAKNETIRDRQPTPRKPLASALNSVGELWEGAPRPALQGFGTPGTPTGGPRKRAADPLAGRDAKRIRIDLESRYKDAESRPLPDRSADMPEPGPKHIGPGFSPPIKPAVSAVKATATPRPELQQPLQGPSGTVPVMPPIRHRAHSAPTKRHQAPATISAAPVQPAPAAPQAPEPPVARNAQRDAWQQSVISKEKQHALERAMRTSIRIPTAGAGSKAPSPLQAGAQPVPRPFYDSKAPML
jgi:acetyltransferase-like isoleucine patch superfamily enzyme